MLQLGARETIKGTLQSILHREGVRGLYHGIGPTLCGIVPYAGLKFYVYQVQFHTCQIVVQSKCMNILSAASGTKTVVAPLQSLKQRYREAAIQPAGLVHGAAAPRLPIEMMLTFGAVSGLIAQTVTYPLDVVRRRMQVSPSPPPALANTTDRIVYPSYRTQSVRNNIILGALATLFYTVK